MQLNSVKKGETNERSNWLGWPKWHQDHQGQHDHEADVKEHGREAEQPEGLAEQLGRAGSPWWVTLHQGACQLPSWRKPRATMDFQLACNTE